MLSDYYWVFGFLLTESIMEVIGTRNKILPLSAFCFSQQSSVKAEINDINE